MNKQSVIDYINGWLKSYSESSHTNGFVVGISGGIDSALTSTLAALTGKKVLCAEMPIHQSEKQVARGREHIHWLMQRFPNVEKVEVELTSVFNQMIARFPSVSGPETSDLALANTRARLRMTCLYYLAQTNGLLVAGTGNKVEDFGVGFFTKYGDGGVDLSPIADLTKTEVFALAAHLGIADSILKSPPTDGLWGDDRTDEDQIGATYPELEKAMAYAEQCGNPAALSGRDKEVYLIFDRLHQTNRHKMVPIPVCIIPPEVRG